MDIELMQAAAPIAAALVARLPASEPNGGVSTQDIKSAFLQAVEALELAQQDAMEGRYVSVAFR